MNKAEFFFINKGPSVYLSGKKEHDFIRDTHVSFWNSVPDLSGNKPKTPE